MQMRTKEAGVIWRAACCEAHRLRMEVGNLRRYSREGKGAIGRLLERGIGDGGQGMGFLIGVALARPDVDTVGDFEVVDAIVQVVADALSHDVEVMDVARGIITRWDSMEDSGGRF